MLRPGFYFRIPRGFPSSLAYEAQQQLARFQVSVWRRSGNAADANRSRLPNLRLLLSGVDALEES